MKTKIDIYFINKQSAVLETFGTEINKKKKVWLNLSNNKTTHKAITQKERGKSNTSIESSCEKQRRGVKEPMKSTIAQFPLKPAIIRKSIESGRKGY
jgi:hypothetical protein